ncbi:zinc finger protein 345-like isoform X1 [Acanthochromis polyacanthus]|uniref:C2H2-type domain-containing protein n=1 Tax=Acanthochromis polyacanthus TaxID=80966 RepID=A0A3Q1GLP3_9TELE|nr:zinc finger protein 345-like isoform X1 [Acanthochromis polyacanthus]
MELRTVMSGAEAPPRCGLRVLADSVSEQLARVGEEVLSVLEKRSGGSSCGGAPLLRLLLSERLAAAAQRIVALLEREVEEYQRQLERQGRLLEAVLSPVVRLTRTDSSPLRTTATDDDLPTDSAHLPIAPLSSASSEVSATESDADWRGDGISDSKTTDRTAGGRRLSKQRATPSDRPENQRCFICEKSFRLRGNLLKHVETHSDDPQRLCGVCGQHVESSDGFSDHLRTHRETGGGTCDVCGKTFQNMETHMRSHTGIKPFNCDVCGKRFPRPGALRRHKKIHSRTEPLHPRTDGGQTEEDDSSDDGQSVTLKPQRDGGHVSGQPPATLCCRVCGDSFHSRGFLRKHAETHCRDAACICGVCGNQLDSPDALLTHLQSHRETSGTCSICGKKFQNMETHMRSHTGIKPYRCGVCAKRFPRPGALRRHKKIHSGERPHVCQYCGKTFIESSALKMHSRSHSWEVQEDDEVQSAVDAPSLMPEPKDTSMPPPALPCCKVCGEAFHSHGSLRKHAKSHSAESICGICGENLPASQMLMDHLQTHRDAGKICHICGKTYQNIDTHMRSHTGVKPYRCGICGKSFPRPGALRRHKRIHSGERPYICEFCGKTFIDNGALTTHIRNHTGDKPANRVSCDTCGKSLASVHVLEVHKRIHTGEKPFQCRVCGKAFRQVGGLNAHMLTHTGEKPFGCSVCGKSFSTKGYLETHLRFHRKERAFSCPLCWKAFVTKNDLKKHLLTHSGEKPYSCRICGKSYQEKRSRDVHMKVHLDAHVNKEPVRGQDALQPDLIQL